MHAKIPKPLCTVYMWKNKYLQNGMQKRFDVSTRMIDVDQNIQGAVSCSTVATCGNGPVKIRESLSDDHRHRKFKETTGLKCQHKYMGIATRKIKTNLRKTESTVEDFMLSAANARNQIDGDQNAMNKLKTATRKTNMQNPNKRTAARL